MADYNHGVRVLEQETSLTTPTESTAGLQVIFGTAPVNLADDPTGVTNVPVIAYSYAEAVSQLGYCTDFKNYTLCQSISACFQVFNVAPVVFVNVLDPAKHRKENDAATVEVNRAFLQATVEIAGILKDTVKVKAGDTELTEGDDYIMEFDDDGYLLISLTADGAGAAATTLTVESVSIDPTAVTYLDIIGGYDAETGKETGLEMIRQVYPKFGVTPGMILAPGWSQYPTVAAAIYSKLTGINGYFKAVGILDIDSSADGATKYTDCYEWKNNNGYTYDSCALLWPQVIVGGNQYAYSAIFAALTASVDADNDDVPNLSPSNKTIGISGIVTADGEEVTLDQTQANVLNGQGIITAINVNGWRSWGNNCACYPSTTDSKERWFCIRRFFTWWGNSFILTYFEKVDDPTNYRLIENIVDSENIRGNAYVSQGKCAGIRVEYLESENSITDILDGKVQFHIFLSPYTPAEDIVATLEFDPDMLQAALSGGE